MSPLNSHVQWDQEGRDDSLVLFSLAGIDNYHVQYAEGEHLVDGKA